MELNKLEQRIIDWLKTQETIVNILDLCEALDINLVDAQNVLNLIKKDFYLNKELPILATYSYFICPKGHKVELQQPKTYCEKCDALYINSYLKVQEGLFNFIGEVEPLTEKEKWEQMQEYLARL